MQALDFSRRIDFRCKAILSKRFLYLHDDKDGSHMKRILSILLLCFLMQSVNIVLAEEVDLSGSWSSEYQLGSEEEALTANIQQG